MANTSIHSPTGNLITQLRTTDVKGLNNLRLLEDFDLTFIHLAESLLHSQAKRHSGISNPMLQECFLSVAELVSLHPQPPLTRDYPVILALLCCLSLCEM